MLRMTPIKDANAAASYFGRSDGGYYLDGKELGREWGGKGASMLGLSGRPEFEQFERLLHGLDPRSGKQLTAQLVEGRVPGWDFTASLPKGVTSAIEGGDKRVQQAVWDSVRETMADIERMAMTRVRAGGKDADRITGNMVWLAVEHPETRPTKADGMPDWDRHIHVVVPNATYDPEERKWKALKVHDIFELRMYFSHGFDLRLSARLSELGYEVSTEQRRDGKGGMRYHSWDIKAAPGHEKGWASANHKNSRRTREVEEAEQRAVAEMKARDADAPDALSAKARDRLGATSRQFKRDDLGLDDLRAYWQGRVTNEEKAAIEATIERATLGMNARPESRVSEAMAFSIAHHFERSSVVAFTDLAVTAMEKCMGTTARPEEFEAEAKRQGVLFKDGLTTTKEVLEQEGCIIEFARAGKGTLRPLAAGKTDGLEGLSVEQAAAVKHVWESRDRVMLIRGGAGTGKTTMMTPALHKLGTPVVLLAPSAEASRGVLRREGFAAANTVAAFLGDGDMQEQARKGIIWVDEAGLCAVKDLDRLCSLARSLDARLVLQGDPKQHRAVARHGNMLEVLEDFAGLQTAKLTEIKRQKGDYAAAVAEIRDGRWQQADARLRELGWVVEGRGHEGIVGEYARAIGEKKPDGSAKSVIVVDPTHKDGDALTDKLRGIRRAKGLIHGKEKTFRQLTGLNWTEARKGDASQYAGDEVIQFFRNSGKFKAGTCVTAAELLPQLGKLKPEHFGVFREGEVAFAVGDVIRITNNGRDVTGKHRLDNGRIDTVAGFSPGGDIVLDNGWVVGKNFAHMKHGLVTTSHASQSKTEDIVLASMNRASLGALGAEQAYVTISRGRERGMIFTDLRREELLAAVAKADARKSATELFAARPEVKTRAVASKTQKVRAFMEKVRHVTRQLQRKAAAVVNETFRQKEAGYAR